MGKAKEEGAHRGHSGLVWAPYGEGLSPPEAPDRQPWGQMHSLTSARLTGSSVRTLGSLDTGLKPQGGHLQPWGPEGDFQMSPPTPMEFRG